jgi:hypothetical protein
MSKKTSKWLYKFSVIKEVDSQESETSKNDKGDDVTVTKTVTKEEPVYFGLRKATRKMFDEGELFYGVTLSQGIKSGLLTKAQLSRRYENDGGFLSEPDKEEYANLYLKLFEKENELQKVQLNLEKSSESKKKEELSKILVDMTSVREQIQEFEANQANIFDQTAENRAKNKTIMWWVLQLSSVTDSEGKTTDLFFGSGDYDSKLDNYDIKEEDGDLHIIEAMRKLAYFVSYWYSGQANSEADFDNINKALETEESEDDETASQAVQEVLTEAVKGIAEVEKAEESTEVLEVVESPVEPSSPKKKPVKEEAPPAPEEKTPPAPEEETPPAPKEEK